MTTKNKTQYAILGILSIASGSGYDIKKYCDTVIANVWNENFGHIYPVLKTMLQEGLIEPEAGASLEERKKRYTITEKGRNRFQSWLSEPAQYTPVRSEFMLKFLFSNHLSKTERCKMLADYKKRHENKLARYRKIKEQMKEGSESIQPDRINYLTATLRYAILSAEAALRWCKEVEEDFMLNVSY
jgi:PadR family transcriptional regulator, regulatory protein AphA